MRTETTDRWNRSVSLRADRSATRKGCAQSSGRREDTLHILRVHSLFGLSFKAFARLPRFPQRTGAFHPVHASFRVISFLLLSATRGEKEREIERKKKRKRGRKRASTRLPGGAKKRIRSRVWSPNDPSTGVSPAPRPTEKPIRLPPSSYFSSSFSFSSSSYLFHSLLPPYCISLPLEVPEIWNKNRVARRPGTSGTDELGTNGGLSLAVSSGGLHEDHAASPTRRSPIFDECAYGGSLSSIGRELREGESPTPPRLYVCSPGSSRADLRNLRQDDWKREPRDRKNLGPAAADRDDSPGCPVRRLHRAELHEVAHAGETVLQEPERCPVRGVPRPRLQRAVSEQRRGRGGGRPDRARPRRGVLLSPVHLRDARAILQASPQGEAGRLTGGHVSGC